MFIPPQKNMTKYFRYDGSLTTPNCAEAVVWSLFESTIPLSRKQVILSQYLIFDSNNQALVTQEVIVGSMYSWFLVFS